MTPSVRPSPLVFLPPRRRPGRLRPLAPLLAAPVLLLLAGAAADRAPSFALVNETRSLPRGLYLMMPGGRLERGAVVAATQPPSARPYLDRLGVPARMLLLKRIAAQPGDQVCADARVLLTPHRVVPVAARDRRGRALPAWRDCRRLGPDEYFLLGDSPTSFDSRYFGPVDRDEVIGVYRAVLRW